MIGRLHGSTLSNRSSIEWEQPRGVRQHSTRGLAQQIGTSDWRAEMDSTRLCSVEGCDRTRRERGMCHTHYERARRNGLAKLPPRAAAPTTTRTLQPGERVPSGTPARYLNAIGYVRLRWLVGVASYVEVYEHRLNAGLPAKHLHVHHVNGNKADNRPENLRVMTATDHMTLHANDPDWVARAKASRPKRQPLNTYPRCVVDECSRAAQCTGRTLCLKHYKARKRAEEKVQSWR